MNNKLFANYRKLFEQAWVPIFGQDEYHTQTLLEGCRLAGLNAIEYTLRRPDANEIIPTLKAKFPDAVVFVGSTIDDGKIVLQMRDKFPQLMTIGELAPYVDGFVSILPYSNETLQKYRDSHLCIPTAETGGEALRQMKNGAAFIKVLGPDFSFSKKLHAVPTFGYCPTFITGGVTKERMVEAFECGNVLCAAGFDVVLRGENPEQLTAERVAECILSYVQAAKQARAVVYPQMKDLETLSDEEFLKAIPNYCSVI